MVMLINDVITIPLNNQFEIIKNYSSIHLRKEFNITQFLDNYPSVLSNQHKR